MRNERFVARAGFSQVFWVAVVAVIAVPLSIDKLFGDGVRPKPASAALMAPPVKGNWRQEADHQIGFSCELPELPTAIDRFSYAGDSGDFHYKFGRVFTPGRPKQSGKSQLEFAKKELGKTPGIAHVHADIASAADWQGAPTVQMTCTFKLDGQESGVFYLVREGARDQTYFQLWFPRSKQNEAAALLAVVRSTARFGP